MEQGKTKQSYFHNTVGSIHLAYCESNQSGNKEGLLYAHSRAVAHWHELNDRLALLSGMPVGVTSPSTPGKAEHVEGDMSTLFYIIEKTAESLGINEEQLKAELAIRPHADAE